MTNHEHTSQEQEFERLDDVYDLIYGTHGDVGGGGYTCVQGCVTDAAYGVWHGHVLAAFLDQERPLTPGRIELTDPDDPRWRDGALVELVWTWSDGADISIHRRRVAGGRAAWGGFAAYLSDPRCRVYLIEEADQRLALIREYVSDPETAVALLARLDEVQA